MSKRAKRKLKLPRVSLPRRQKKDVAERFDEAVKGLPNITTDTLAAHREEVLSSARKYIYPLQHSKHRIVFISTSLFGIGLVVFLAYCLLGLYRFQSSSTFLYDVTRVIPFPIAKVGPSYVAYENYLFELRREVHYYQNQQQGSQQLNLSTATGKQQLAHYKQQALNEVVDQAYIKQLASKYQVRVTNQQVNDQITLLENQNRLGNNTKELEGVLSQFWGWSLDDFKRELKSQLLAENVVAKLDTATNNRANAALKALQGGADFGTVAGQYSDDSLTKGNGGKFGFTITANSQAVAPQTLRTLLSLQPGQISGIISLGTGLEIDKVLSSSNGQIQAAHIVFNFADISNFIGPLQAKDKPHYFIKPPSTQS